MSAAARVRPAAAADIPAIEALLRAAELPTEGVAEIVRDSPAAFVVAEADGVVVGAGGLEPAGADALLRSVVVRSDLRASGVGRLIVERLLADADARCPGCVYLLTTTADNWFPRFGFANVARGSVPHAVGQTWEFKTGCAQTAVAMKRSRPGT